MADIVLVNPRFEVSYWGLEHALPLLGKRATLPTACLPLLAALTPAGAPRHDRRRERRADRLRPTRPGRHRRPHRHERPARPHARDPGASSKRRGVLHRRRRSVGQRAGGLLRRPGRRRSSSARPRRPGRSSWTTGRTAGIQRRYEQAERTDMTHGAGAALRPARRPALPVRQRAVLARLSVSVRVLRHHRHLRPPAAAEDAARR